MATRRITIIVSVFFLFFSLIAKSQDGYKTPPKDIADMLLAKASPNVSVDDKGEWMVFIETNSYPSVEELANSW